MDKNTVSFWNQTGQKTHYPRLNKSVIADVLIVGGGITGITCAYCLAKKGRRPLLIETGGLCDGTTGNTTGKVTVQHGLVYYKIMKKYGLDAVRDYASSQNIALEFVRSVTEKENISCQLSKNTAYIYGVNENEWDALQKEYETAKAAGIDAELVGQPAFPPGSQGLLGYRISMYFIPSDMSARLGRRP